MAKNTHGGPGRGQGRHPSKNPRSIQRQIRWTEGEWRMVVEAAGKINVADFQRAAILKKCEDK
jgi:hypothetical protein